MAGYVILPDNPNAEVQFHIGTPNLGQNIRRMASMDGRRSGRVITFQLDCDELDAALWGLENYVKP